MAFSAIFGEFALADVVWMKNVVLLYIPIGGSHLWICDHYMAPQSALSLLGTSSLVSAGFNSTDLCDKLRCDTISA